MSTHDDAEEKAVRRKLGEAMMEFVRKIMTVAHPEPPLPNQGEQPRKLVFDHPMREHVTEIYRQAVEEAAAKGIETALSWHTLAVWTNEGRERIGYFARALDCIECNRDGHLLPPGANTRWSQTNLRAECLYEIGRVHANEGDPAVAREFLLRAMPLAAEAERLRGPAGITHEYHLEGKIEELLVQLPDENDEPTSAG